MMNKFDAGKFGVTKKHNVGSLKYSAIITLIGIAVVTSLGFVVGFKQLSIDYVWLVFYVLISAPIQEIIFRGFIQSTLYKIGTRNSIIITSVLFSSIHFWSLILMGLTLVAGLVWGYTFYKKPNILGPAISHAILGSYLFLLVL